MSFPHRTYINFAKPPGIPTMCSLGLDLAPYIFVRPTDPSFDSLIRSFCSASRSWEGTKSKYIMVRLFNPSLENNPSHRLPSQKSITIFSLFISFSVCIGESIEIHYALHSYGIPTEHIPLTFSGNIKDTYIKQWIKMRGYVESKEFDFQPIECPQLDDVLFRQGVSSLSYPGNSWLHRFVESKYAEHPEVNPKRGTVKSKREKVVREIIEVIRSIGGRFLVWNDTGWWTEILGMGPLSVKLEYFIKEVLRTKRKEERLARSRHRLHLDCSTSVFQRHSDEGSCVSSNKRTKREHYLGDVRGV